jgi:hypothetical protein
MLRFSGYRFLSITVFMTLAVTFRNIAANDTRLLIVTVATEATDGYIRFMKSAEHFGLDVKVVGMGEEWRGGDVARFAGGGHKINMLVRDLAPYKDDKELVIMFTDSYDVVLLAGQDTILSKFSDFESSLVFSAEGFCWPDKSLAVSK